VDGQGADSVIYTGITTSGTGLWPGFNEEAFKITIGPFTEWDIGRTICLDSASRTTNWYWSDSTGYVALVPGWGGPYCFEVRGDSILYYGYLFYYDSTPGVQSYVPARNCRIDLWDDDQYPNPDDSLATAWTEDNGWFEIGPVENSDIFGTLDIFFRYYAENGAAYVTESYNGARKRVQTPTIDDVPSGEYELYEFLEAAASGPFFVADAVLEARSGWTDLWPEAPPQVQVVSNTNDNGSHYDPSEQAIHLPAKVDNTRYLPDTWDRDVICHEYSHFLQFTFGFFDLNIPGNPEHHWDGQYGVDRASQEGSATFLANVLLDSSFLHNYDNLFVNDSWVNSEDGRFGLNQSWTSSANNYGLECEGAVAGILWDIYDSQNDDYSTDTVWGIPNRYNPDGIGDTLSDGPYNIIDVLMIPYIGGSRPDDIEEFWASWFTTPSLGHDRAMHDIWYEHGAVKCCIGIRGNVNNDPAQGINIVDVTWLTQYLLVPGSPPPPCMPEGDVNGDGDVNIVDQTYLIAFCFGTGPEPVSCP